MTPEERSDYLLRLDLDTEHLLGNAMLSERSVFLIRSADTAFVGGANLAAVL